MPLQERLFEDLKQAMRQGDEVKRSTLRLLRAAIQNEEIAQGKPLDDAGVAGVLSRQARQRQESITEFRRGKREDLVAREEAELAIIRQYMPQQLTHDEIVDLARRVIAEVGAKSPSEAGKVMGRLMPQVRGKAEGSEVGQVVRDLLAGTA